MSRLLNTIWPSRSPSPAPHLTPPTTASVTNDHLAFRSITLLTSKIQEKATSAPIKEDNGKHSTTLLLSVAFSILLALQFEVVAVTAKIVKGNLQVVLETFADYLGIDGLSISLLASRNPRKQDKGDKSSFPNIVNSEFPSNLSANSTEQDLDNYVLKLCTNEEPEQLQDYPLTHHLAVLCQLLLLKPTSGIASTSGGMGTAASIGKLLFRYIVAVAYKKLHSRIYFIRDGRMRPRSKSFITFLTVQWSSLRPRHVVKSGNKPEDSPKDRDFLNYLAVLPVQFHTSYPALHNLGMAVKAKTAERRDENPLSENLQLYTEETEQEFHELFVECLNGYVKGLQRLHHIRRNPTPRAPDEFSRTLSSVVRYGTCLRPLIRSSALQKHIIALCSRHPDMQRLANDIDDRNDGENNDEDGEDVEPLETDPGISPLVKPYRDWLRLVTAEFDSANYLLQFFVAGRGSKLTQIPTQVLTPSYTSSAILPWETLFQDFIVDNDDINNKEIFNYLTTIKSSIELATTWLSDLRKQKSDVKELQDMIGREAFMMKHGGTVASETRHGKGHQIEFKNKDWWKEWLKEPSQNFNVLPDWPPLLAEIVHQSPSTRSLDELFSSLNSSLWFFKNLAMTDTDNDANFSCRIHCETCLASLLFPQNTQSIRNDENYKKTLDDIAPFLMDNKEFIIGVSKRCCPVCRYMMTQLVPINGNVITRGDHSTVSPCSLPLWLPSHVVQSMRSKFSDFLRTELVRLIKEPQSSYKKLADSGGSAARSSDSGHDLISFS